MARFYRIVRGDPPTVEDFLSHAERGRPVPVGAPRDVARSWTAVSVYDSIEAARSAAATVARRGRSLGTHVAALEIPEDAPVQSEQTFGAGHYDLRAGAADLLAYVVAVIPL